MSASSKLTKAVQDMLCAWLRRCRAGGRMAVGLAAAALLGGCVPIGVRIQNMFGALLG